MKKMKLAAEQKQIDDEKERLEAEKNQIEEKLRAEKRQIEEKLETQKSQIEEKLGTKIRQIEDEKEKLEMEKRQFDTIREELKRKLRVNDENMMVVMIRGEVRNGSDTDQQGPPDHLAQVKTAINDLGKPSNHILFCALIAILFI